MKFIDSETNTPPTNNECLVVAESSDNLVPSNVVYAVASYEERTGWYFETDYYNLHRYKVLKFYLLPDISKFHND